MSLEAAEAPELKLWDFHNLLFHSRSRQGRHDYPTGDIAASVGVWDQFPVVKPPMAGTIVPLPQFSIDAIRQRDKTLTTALEKRQSIREYDDHQPITVEQLGEFLYRTARVKEVYSLEAEQQALFKAEFGEAFDWGELSRRPYPCGGAMYELEIYPVVRHCAGVNPGLYHYDPLNHHLAQLDTTEADLQALLQDAHQSSGAQGVPQVLLIITARFGRLFRKYRSLAYALVLKHVGVLYENFYLVATAMDLAPCALGAGDSDRFAHATGLDYVVESSVGEFMLGSLPTAEVKPSQPADTSETEVTPDDPVNASDLAIAEVEPTVSPSSPAPLPPSPLPSTPTTWTIASPASPTCATTPWATPALPSSFWMATPTTACPVSMGQKSPRSSPTGTLPPSPCPRRPIFSFRKLIPTTTWIRTRKPKR
ncbi:MAG: SagB family peptide dehydrogenase [Nodosilinea sp. LVE1205-7]